jgi:hypothetical protein
MTEKFSASRAAKHMACPASANLPLAIPNWVPPDPQIRGAAADHGTDMHEIFEKLMALSATEMEYWIQVLEYVAALRRTRRFKVLREQSIEATWLPADPVTGEHVKTTVDLVLYTQDELHVIDLKWGKIKVEVIDNDQCMYYGVSFAHLAPKADGMTLHILQPAADNMASHFVTATEMQQWMQRAVQAQLLIHKGDTTFGPSDHCKFCPAYPHSRSAKGAPLCPATMQLLYPTPFNEDEILNL